MTESIAASLQGYLEFLQNQPPCWYCVHSEPSEPFSLCTLLGINPEWYPTFLLEMKFSRKYGVNLRSNYDDTETFATEHNHDFQRYKKEKGGPRQVYFLVGDKSSCPQFSVGEQMKRYTNLHGSKKFVIPALDLEGRWLFQKTWLEVRPQKMFVPIQTKTSTSKATLPLVVTPSIDSNKNNNAHLAEKMLKEKILDILGCELLSKLFDDRDLEDVVSLFRISLTVDEVLDSVSETHNQVREQQASLLRKKKAALDFATQPQQLTVLPSKFPYISSKGIDVTNSHEISCLLREVLKLQKAVVSKDNVDIFQFLQGNDKTTMLIRVPTNKTKKHFHHNFSSNNKGYNFVLHLLDAMLPPTPADGDVGEDDDGDHDRMMVEWTRPEQAAEGIMTYLANKFGASFIRAAAAVGMPVMKSNRMDVPTSAAMCDDAGLSNFQKRIINKYSTYTLGHPLTAPEREMKTLGENAILSICGDVEVNKERCPYFKKDPVEVIEKKVTEAIEHDTSVEWDRLDIVFGGDHGQGAFRVPIKLLLKNDRQEVKIEEEYNIAEIECKKDTSKVLRGTIFLYLNERLKTIIKYERDPIKNEIIGTNDGSLYEYHCFQEGVAVTRFSFQHNAAEEGEDLVRERPITFIVTGDLAFYAVILGMKNGAGYHCHLCRLRKTDWEREPWKKGDARSMDWLLNNFHHAKSGKGGRICGVIERPLLDVIDPCRFVVPPLHSMLGVANSILNDFKLFIDLLLEDAPPKLKALRSSELIAEKALNDKIQEIEDWGTLNGAALAECHEDEAELLTLQHSILVAGVGSDEERNAINEEMGEIHERLASLNNEREALVAEEALLSKNWKRKKARLSAFLKTKDGKRFTKPVKARFEGVLRKFGVDYAAYHGGDLVGNDCRILMGRAEEIFQQVEVMLLAVAVERRSKAETKEAIKSRCAGVRDALVVFDSVFAIVNKPNANVEMEEDLPRLEMLLKKASVEWRNLKDCNERGDKNITPKVHGIIQHLPSQFQLYGGIGDYDEQFVERNHQIGKKDKLRGRNFRDVKIKFTSFSFREEARKNRKVIAKAELVRESCKRNFKGERKPTAKEESSTLRENNRTRIISSIIERDLSGESARILAMNELTEYNPEEEDIDYDLPMMARGERV